MRPMLFSIYAEKKSTYNVDRFWLAKVINSVKRKAEKKKA